MAHIISITSLKGGVGKTTTAVNLAASFAMLEKKTLIIDCDPQGNAAIGLGIDKSHIPNSIAEALNDKVNIQDAIYNTALKYLNCIPSDYRLAYLEKAIQKQYLINPEKILKNKLRALENIYDYIIIDTPSAVDFLTKCALTASKWVVIPLTYEFYTIETLTYSIMRIKEVKKALNPYLSVAGLLLTMYQKSNYISDNFSSDLFADFNKLTFKTIIPYDPKLNEAIGEGQPIALYDIMAKSAEAHLEFADELMNVIKTN